MSAKSFPLLLKCIEDEWFNEYGEPSKLQPKKGELYLANSEIEKDSHFFYILDEFPSSEEWDSDGFIILDEGSENKNIEKLINESIQIESDYA